jgi:hypothetical protein
MINKTIPADPAAVVATAILQIVRSALLAWLHRDHADMASARAEIEEVLRTEFYDIERQVAADRLEHDSAPTGTIFDGFIQAQQKFLHEQAIAPGDLGTTGIKEP